MKKLTDPKVQRWFHGAMVLVWLVLIYPSVTSWKESLPWLVLMSVWANLAAHWSAFQGANADVHNNEEDD